MIFRLMLLIAALLYGTCISSTEFSVSSKAGTIGLLEISTPIYSSPSSSFSSSSLSEILRNFEAFSIFSHCSFVKILLKTYEVVRMNWIQRMIFSSSFTLLSLAWTSLSFRVWQHLQQSKSKSL